MRGDKTYLTIFSVIAVMIMLIACINYTNLATARSVKRSKEVGLANRLGARSQIANQFFLESFLMTCASLIMSILLVLIFFIPSTNWHINLLRWALIQPYMMVIVGVSYFYGLYSGIYPALYLSGFKPVKVLKGQW